MRVAVASACSDRDVAVCLAGVDRLCRDARDSGADLLVLPEGALGGCFGASDGAPTAFDLDGPEVQRLCALAGALVLCVGLAERTADGTVHDTALCLSGDGVHGEHRKVHAPAREAGSYVPGTGFAAFDTPVGRVGMLLGYDKAFPEAARALALDGAELLAVLSAWSVPTTDVAGSAGLDRQSRLLDLYDAARAVDNQVFVASANQWGTVGDLQMLGRAQVVSPSGEVLASTGSAARLTVADVDLGQVHRSRRPMHHLRDRRPDAYPAPRPVVVPA